MSGALDCPFCDISPDRILWSGADTVAVADAFPVSPGHALVVTRRHVPTYFDATEAETSELWRGVQHVKRLLDERHRPAGYNVGFNAGTAAGQTVMHLHVHVIPRYEGDVPDPTGGVRHVVPALANYRVGLAAGSPPSATPRSQREFTDLLLSLLQGDRARKTSTYKYAVLLGLMDLCLLETEKSGAPPAMVTTRQLAERVLELYWPHTRPFALAEGQPHRVLKQNTVGQAEILSRIADYQDAVSADPGVPLSRARHADPKRFERLLDAVEWKLVEMPLPRLQRLGDEDLPLLYQIGWGDDVTVSQFRGVFDNRILLLPQVGDWLVQLAGVLRPVVQRRWASMIATLNSDLVQDADLEDFLFGARRELLDPVRRPLVELQKGECFYCRRKMDGRVDVDHFVPWARVPTNSVDNLVAAHAACNNSKSDHLAAVGHVGQWVSRLATQDAALAAIASEVKWDRPRGRALNIARALYFRLPRGARLWKNDAAFEVADVAALRGLLVG